MPAFSFRALRTTLVALAGAAALFANAPAQAALVSFDYTGQASNGATVQGRFGWETSTPATPSVFGPGNVILVNGQLLALSDKGELVVVAADPKGYQEIARADLLQGKCWSTPALADGKVFIRSTKEAGCFDLSGAKVSLR